MSIGRAIDRDRVVLRFQRVRCHCIGDQGDIEPLLRTVLASGFNTRIGNHPDQDDVAQTSLIELHRQISVCEPALVEMLADNQITFLRTKVRVECAAS